MSTVDSSNLAGHLLVLRQGLLELPRQSVMPSRLFEGLLDSARVLREAVQNAAAPDDAGDRHRTHADVLRLIGHVEADLAHPPMTLRDSFGLLTDLARSTSEIAAAACPDADVQWWAAALARSVADHRDDVLRCAPWLALPATPNATTLVAEGSAVQAMLDGLDHRPTLIEIAALHHKALPIFDAAGSDASIDPNAKAWLGQMRTAVVDASKAAENRVNILGRLAQECQGLLGHGRAVPVRPRPGSCFRSAYNVANRRLDDSYYDLLASESRLGSFVSVAEGRIGQEHWFALGRLLTATGAAPALLSWSGSMFEYLMPLLVMPSYEGTLLDRTYRAVVQRQIAYGKQRGVPWGISESGYNTTDQHLNYQYRAFGVPGLGLKRGLADDLVVAPYATAMALMVAPEAACRNLERLAADGQQGAYGFYEAIDFTPSRLLPGTTSVTLRQFMAHHQGMSLLSLAYLLLARPMQRRFEADPSPARRRPAFAGARPRGDRARLPTRRRGGHPRASTGRS